jgi:FdhD protein
VVATRPVVTVDADRRRHRVDALAVEEPMEIRVDDQAVSVTMRTPGDDFELAVGFCLTEGILDSPGDVARVRYCAGKSPDAAEPNPYNVVDVVRRSPAPVAPSLRRNVYTASSCGLCGTASIDAVRKRVPDVAADPLEMPVETVRSLPARIRSAQRVFDRTGGLHAAALFDTGGGLRCLREDVGRHNAVDKVIGWAALQGLLPLSGHVLMVSGRVAFEIVQKALAARVPMVAAVSAPSSLAVSLAESSGMTLVGFLRGERMNVYTRADRVPV